MARKQRPAREPPTSPKTEEAIRLKLPKGRAAPPKTSVDQIVERGREAWERLKKGGRDWEDWKALGAALLDGRNEAMRKAQTNKPAGKAYSAAFSDWLKANHFDIDKSDRAKLLQMMAKLEDVEAFRASLKPKERMRLNHPSSVWRAFTSPDRGKAFLDFFGGAETAKPDAKSKERAAPPEQEQKPGGANETNQEEHEPDGGKDGLDQNVASWWSWLLKTRNEIERDDGLVKQIERETGLAETNAEARVLKDRKHVAALQANTDRMALAGIRAAGERQKASGERVIKVVEVLEKVHALLDQNAKGGPEEQPAQAA
jgi:hypothetical protein